jgi:hypothetical protein
MSSANRIITSGRALVLCPKIKQHFGVSAALVLQQLHYWLSKENLSYGVIDENGCQWIRNTYEQWCEQIQVLTLSTLRRAFSTLEKNNIILSQRFTEKSRYSGGNQVKFYTINYDQLEAVMGDLEKSSINKPSRFAETNSGAGDTILETTSNDSQTEQQHKNPEHIQNSSKQPTHLLKMNTLPAQNEQPLYITKTTSQNTSKKTSLSEASQQLESTEHSSIDIKTIQPDKPAEREKINIVEDMISFWNEIIEQTPNKIALTPKRSQHLNAAFKQFFNSNLADWEAFCCKIASSKFLMGEVTNFKAYLDWSIRFEIIQRILEGGYSFGDRVVNYTPRVNQLNFTSESIAPPSSLHDNTHPQLEKEQESQEAVHIRNQIKRNLDTAIYKSWFEDTSIVCEQSDDLEKKATIYVSSRFIADRLRTHYADIIERYFNAIQVGEPPKTESVTYSEITSTESVTPFVELLVTENNVETVSECTPELSNQVTLDIKAQQKNPMDTYKCEFLQAERVQHEPEVVSDITDESHNIDCEINMESPNPRSRVGECPLTNYDHKDIHTDVMKQGLPCESQMNLLHSHHSTKQSDALNQIHKTHNYTEKINQRELGAQESHFLKTTALPMNKLEETVGFYANIRSMWFLTLNTYSKDIRRVVTGGYSTRMLIGTKFLQRIMHLMCCKAVDFIDSTILDPSLSFYDLKMKFLNNVLANKAIV